MLTTQLVRLTLDEVKDRVDEMIDQRLDRWLEVTLRDTDRMFVVAVVAWLDAKDDVDGASAAHLAMEEVVPCGI
jgi:hypothetical protein